MGVSVIIPVFNTEKELNKCLDSVLSQTYIDFEIVLVDDGSTDNSGEICDEYAEKYENINVIHQENAGLAMARLAGCRNAKYEYITFVDSDDYIEKNLIENLVNRISRDCSELVISHLIVDEGGKSTKNNTYVGDVVLHKSEYIERLIDNELGTGICIEGSMCGKLFLKEKLVLSLSKMNVSLTYGEDLEELFLYIEQIDAISIMHFWAYHYVRRDNSMNNNADIMNYTKLKSLYDFFHDNDFFDEENKGLIRQSDFFIRNLLIETTEGVFPEINMGFISYVPPYEIIPKSCNLAVYGAGKVGRSMMKCLLSSGYANIVGWFDKTSGMDYFGMDVQDPSMINECRFDYILIAISKAEYVGQIRNTLCSIGVSENKILWKRPYSG